MQLDRKAIEAVNMTADENENLERYLNDHTEEIITWVNGRLITEFRPSGEIFDRLANQAVRDFPYGPGIDNTHRFLTSAIMGALWCGWFAQSHHDDPQFRREYLERFRTIITRAFEIGRRHAENP